MKRNYIGLANSCHDSGLAIVDASGDVVFAEATERYMQNKRAFNIAPDIFKRTASLINKYCDPDAELVVAHTWSSSTGAQVREGLNELEKTVGALTEYYGEVPEFMRRHFAFNRFVAESQLNLVSQAARTIEYDLSQIENRSNHKIITRTYDHHLTHAATACYTSPFSEGVCAILDGYGEERAFACYKYRDGKIEEIKEVKKGSLGSLGAFYIYVCDACGFGQLLGEEWKVMGLAPYGKFNEEYYNIFRELISVNGLNIEFCSDTKFLQLFQRIHNFRRTPDQPPIAAADIAFAGQKVFNEVIFEFLNNLYERGVSQNLILGGGCALNSSANGKILQNTGFEKLHIFSAPADDGNAIGAALFAYYQDHHEQVPKHGFQSPYLGSKMSNETLENIKSFGNISRLTDYGDLAYERAAELLSDGKIIGWVQGGAEFGPRALGNRSILADPRSSQVKEKINSSVKFREEYRPFAPSILHEYGDEYFEHYQESPYMERTLRFRPEVLDKVPGVVHEDGTGRLQTVKREWNEKYHALIEKFHEITGIPLVLNTSFNVMGKPIAHSVEDAIAIFYTSGLDALIIEGLVIEK